MKRALILVAVAVGLTFLSTSGPASARGCGGYVNQMVWGCAAWDNNPMCPYHPNCKKAQRPTPSQVYQPVRPGYNSGNGLVSQGGGNLVSQGGGNILTPAGSNRPRGY